ncbi:MAG: hypothetical protein MZW92_49670 [Comamonadaceae bacterium]|nr:hypothetical protein [Comamonadaceae bacterium]
MVQTLLVERSETAARALPADRRLVLARRRRRADRAQYRVCRTSRCASARSPPARCMARVTMDRNGALRMLRFAGSGALSGELAPNTAGYRIKLSGVQGWAPDFMAPLAFDYFEAEGSLTADAMRLGKVYGRMADGSIVGRGDDADERDAPVERRAGSQARRSAQAPGAGQVGPDAARKRQRHGQSGWRHPLRSWSRQRPRRGRHDHGAAWRAGRFRPGGGGTLGPQRGARRCDPLRGVLWPTAGGRRGRGRFRACGCTPAS